MSLEVENESSFLTLETVLDKKSHQKIHLVAVLELGLKKKQKTTTVSVSNVKSKHSIRRFDHILYYRNNINQSKTPNHINKEAFHSHAHGNLFSYYLPNYINIQTVWLI